MTKGLCGCGASGTKGEVCIAAVLRRLLFSTPPARGQRGDQSRGVDCVAVATIGISVTTASETRKDACAAKDVTYDCSEEVAYDASTIHSAPLIDRARYAARLTLEIMADCRSGVRGPKVLIVSYPPSTGINVPVGPISGMLRSYSDAAYDWAVRVFTAAAAGHIGLLPGGGAWNLSGDVAEALGLTGYDGHHATLMGIFRCVMGR